MAWHVVLFFHDTGHESILGIISIDCHTSRNSNIRCPLIVLERWTPIPGMRVRPSRQVFP